MSVIHVNSNDFEEVVLNSEIPVLVDFYADWCGPCKMVAPIIEELSEEFEGKVKFCKLDVDEAGDIAGTYAVMSIPTIIMFVNGKNVDQITGAGSKETIVDFVENNS